MRCVVFAAHMDAPWVRDDHPTAAFSQRAVVEQVLGRTQACISPHPIAPPPMDQATRHHSETARWSTWKHDHAVHPFAGGVWWRAVPAPQVLSRLQPFPLPDDLLAFAHHGVIFAAVDDQTARTHAALHASLRAQGINMDRIVTV